MPGSSEGLTGLVARFTAERDELLTRVQECQDRVTDLAERLGPDRSSPVAAEDAMRGDVDVLRAEISGLEAELAARLDADVAWQAAMLETREAIEQRLAAHETEIATTYDRLAPLEEFRTRMEAAMEKWIEAGLGAGAERDVETALLRERIDVLSASVTRLSDGMEDLGAMRASLAGVHRRIDELGAAAAEIPDGVVDALERIRMDVEALRADVARNARPDATAALAEGLNEVRLAISALKNQLRALDTAITTGLRSTSARWDGEARVLAARIDEVSRLFAAHAEAHRRSLQDRATEWARIAGTLVATELQRLGDSLPSLPQASRLLSLPTSLLNRARW
jgi:chromosome segregation ATPase